MTAHNFFAPLQSIDRRSLLALLGAATLVGCRGGGQANPFAEIEARLGGRVGVQAIDLGSGTIVGHREHERFALCSTFKWALAAQILAMVDAGELGLYEPVRYTKADLVAYSPATERAASGAMSVRELCEAAVELSDNSAANLLLRLAGGPAGFTAFVRSVGDRVTRLDRWETELNENARGDPRDTTSPAAMAFLLRRLLFSSHLDPRSEALLKEWMEASTTGRKRLRAGLPQGWSVGDKTGTSGNGAANDVAFAVPPGRKPILIAAYVNAPGADAEALDAAHRAIARAVTGGPG